MAQSHDRNEGKPPWHLRRKIILTTLVFCAACIAYIMIWGGDTRVNETIILGSFATGSAVIGSYVFAATWGDHQKRSASAQDGDL